MNGHVRWPYFVSMAEICLQWSMTHICTVPNHCHQLFRGGCDLHCSGAYRAPPTPMADELRRCSVHDAAADPAGGTVCICTVPHHAHHFSAADAIPQQRRVSRATVTRIGYRFLRQGKACPASFVRRPTPRKGPSPRPSSPRPILPDPSIYAILMVKGSGIRWKGRRRVPSR